MNMYVRNVKLKKWNILSCLSGMNESTQTLSEDHAAIAVPMFLVGGTGSPLLLRCTDALQVWKTVCSAGAPFPVKQKNISFYRMKVLLWMGLPPSPLLGLPAAWSEWWRLEAGWGWRGPVLFLMEAATSPSLTSRRFNGNAVIILVVGIFLLNRRQIQLKVSPHLWHSSLQNHIVNRHGCCVEHGHHHHQHVGSHRRRIGRKVDEHTDPIFIIGSDG